MNTLIPAGARDAAQDHADQAYHFGMFMMKAVLDGRTSQLIDLAKVKRSRRVPREREE
jgi:hypothetical protein